MIMTNNISLELKPFESPYLKSYEWLPKYAYHTVPKNEHDRFINSMIVKTFHQIRLEYGRCTVNTWQSGGDLSYCGWRPVAYRYGSENSHHKFGNALDIHIDSIEKLNLTRDEKIMEYNKIRKAIIDNRTMFPFLTCVEWDVTWLHIDVRNHDVDTYGIFVVYPS